MKYGVYKFITAQGIDYRVATGTLTGVRHGSVRVGTIEADNLKTAAIRLQAVLINAVNKFLRGKKG